MIDRLYRLREAAEIAQVHERTLQRQIEAGTGPTLTRIGKRILIRESDLKRWLDRCRQPRKGFRPAA